MASFHHSFLLLLFSLTLQAQISTPLSPNSFILPITKDVTTLQYITQIHHGTPLSPIHVVLDLGGSNLWLDCSISPSRRIIPHRSIECSSAKPITINPNNLSKKCNLYAENSISKLTHVGELVEDIIAIGTHHRRHLFTCAPPLLLNGLASGARGILGLGKTPIGFATQIAMGLNYDMKFLICLSSSKGLVLFGKDISKNLMFTPLMSVQEKFYINVKSMKINGAKIPIGKTKISTIVPYTRMESSVYEKFVNAFKESAVSMNMSVAEAVEPFGLCFYSKGSEMVPEIEIGLQSEMVKWRIGGRNSMVKVSDEVMCLGILDGGMKMEDCVMEIGGFQLEDVVLEFDKGKSMMGFSSSLVIKGKSCSDFELDDGDREFL